MKVWIGSWFEDGSMDTSRGSATIPRPTLVGVGWSRAEAVTLVAEKAGLPLTLKLNPLCPVDEYDLVDPSTRRRGVIHGADIGCLPGGLPWKSSTNEVTAESTATGRDYEIYWIHEPPPQPSHWLTSNNLSSPVEGSLLECLLACELAEAAELRRLEQAKNTDPRELLREFVDMVGRVYHHTTEMPSGLRDLSKRAEELLKAPAKS